MYHAVCFSAQTALHANTYYNESLVWFKISDFQSTVNTGPSQGLDSDILWLSKVRVILLLGGASGGGVRAPVLHLPFLPLDDQHPEAPWAQPLCLPSVGSTTPCVLPLARLYSFIFPSHFSRPLFESIFPQDLLFLLVLGMLQALQAPPLPSHLCLGSSMGLWGFLELLQGLTAHAGGGCHLLSQPYSGFQL